jgi:hypothetical protein
MERHANPPRIPVDVGKPHWAYSASIYKPKVHCLVYRDEQLKVQLQIITPRNPTLLWRKPKEFFFIDGVERIFRSEDTLLKALGSSGADGTHPVSRSPLARMGYRLIEVGHSLIV